MTTAVRKHHAMRLIAAVVAVALTGSLPATAEPTAPEGSSEPAGIRIEQTEVGNVFRQGQRPTVRVHADAARVRWRLVDFWGHRLTCRRLELPGGSATLRLPTRRVGYYELRIAAGGCKTEPTARTTLAVLPHARRSASDGFTYGMQTHFSKPGWPLKLVPLVSKLGVEAVRDAQPWNEIERRHETPRYRFGARGGRFVDYMRRLDDADLDAQIGLGVWHDEYDGGCVPASDTAQAALGDFAAAVVGRYGDQLDQLSVYNEPNLKQDTAECPNQGTVRRHLRITRAVRTAVRESGSDVPLVAPELAQGTPQLPDANHWFGDFVRRGGMDDVQIAAVHPYRPWQKPESAPEQLWKEQLGPVRRTLRKQGQGSKPVWITELGWQSHNAEQEDLATGYLPRAYVLARRHGVPRLNWYAFMDHKGRTFGLVRDRDDPLGPHTPRSTYVAYAVMTSQLAGRSYVARDAAAPRSVHSHRFGGRVPMRVMWATDGPERVRLRASDPVVTTDVMGRERVLHPEDGHVRLTLSGYPRYVRGAVDWTGGRDAR